MSTLVLSVSVLFLLIQFVHYALASKQEIELIAINSVSVGAKTILGAEWIAVEEINNNTDILPNYHFSLQIHYAESLNAALNHVITILKTNEKGSSSTCTNTNNTNNTNIRFPIVLGVGRSSYSTLVASVIGVNHMGLMSASSTSVSLSDTDTYPYFYRTIASDALQSKGIIYLCNQFNWKSIVVVYANDAYGLFLSLGIQELAKIYDIDVDSVAIQYEDSITFNYAAKQIKALNKYIIILIHNAPGLVELFGVFKEYGLMGYPYYYLGVDSWLDSSVISAELGNEIQGFIGTLPWNINTLNVSEYDDDILDVIHESEEKTNALLDKWDLYNMYNITPRTFVVYAYDVIYSIAHLIQEIETQYGIGSMVDLIENNSSNQVMDLLHSVMTQNVNFYGASGDIKFTPNGDRENGFFSFANIMNDGSMNYFGYFMEITEAENVTGLDSIRAHIDIEKIIWPKYLTEKGIIPHSDIIIKHKRLLIHRALFVTITAFCILLIMLVLAAMIFTIYHKKHVIIKRGSYRMNCIMCIGCILSLMTAILFGIDEGIITDAAMTSMCQLRLFMSAISFSITMMPLFLKQWRLVQIFNDMSSVRRVYDKQLFLYIVICVIIDSVLVSITMFIGDYKRLYYNGDFQQMDTLQHRQEIYGICWFQEHHSITLLFLIILILWKMGQLLFAVYCALNVGRIHNNPDGNTNVIARLAKFDETSAQLGSIALVFIILCISILIAALIPNDSPTVKYVVISSTILLIGIVVFLLNLSLRIFAVFRNDAKLNEKYKKSMEQIFKQTLRQKLLRMESALRNEERSRSAASSYTTGSIVAKKSTMKGKPHAQLAEYIDTKSIESTSGDESAAVSP